jgi:hypothetical protein
MIAGGTFLPFLSVIHRRAASAILWYPELKHYVLDKIKQINEGAI